MTTPVENLWVELVGNIIIARIRGAPTETLLRVCQDRIVALLKDTQCPRVMYDALELDRPPVDLVLVQQTLTTALLEPSLRIAIVVSNTGVAYLARLAFGDANHRVFYSDMPAALKWLDDSPRLVARTKRAKASPTPDKSAKSTRRATAKRAGAKSRGSAKNIKG